MKVAPTSLRAGAPMLLAVLISASRYVLRARVPDDYDSIGFVAAVDHFDLARFQPHFPGYPVYVALCRAAHFLLPSALDAATLVSALASGVTSLALFRIAHRLVSERAAYCVIALYFAAALPWIAGGAALSDSTAAAFFAVAFAALIEKRPILSGLSIALMLGTRASYFPLLLSWFVVLLIWRRAHTVRAFSAAFAGTLVWLVPFALLVGPRELIALGQTHLTGHFTEWGGSIVTRPDPGLRVVAFLRDIFFDGIAPATPALMVLGLLVLTAWRFRKHRRPSREALLAGLLSALPYSLWALLGQNVIDQPRHVLPLVILTVLLIGCLLAQNLALAGLAVAVVLCASLPVALSHANTKPAGAQLADYVAAHYPASDSTIFGGRSVRFLRHLHPELACYERGMVSEVDVSLARLNSLPHRILTTSELESDPRRAARLLPGPMFCRNPVLDRREPCVQLFEYLFRGGTAQ